MIVKQEPSLVAHLRLQSGIKVAIDHFVMMYSAFTAVSLLYET